jgi:hypothetical protein
VWDVPPAVRRDRESAAAHALRLEILGRYAGDAARGAA